MVRRKLKKILTLDELEYLLQKYSFYIDGDDIVCDLVNVMTRVVRYKKDQKIILSFLNLPTDRRVFHISDLAREIFFESKGKKNLLMIDQLLTILIHEKREYQDISKEEFDQRYNDLLLDYFLIKGQTIK